MNGKCLVCSGPMPEDYEPEFCCSGRDCGCRGLPTEPPICSKKCGEKWMKKKYSYRLEKPLPKPIFTMNYEKEKATRYSAIELLT